MASAVKLDFVDDEREGTFYGSSDKSASFISKTYFDEQSLNNPAENASSGRSTNHRETDLLVPDMSEEQTLDNEKSTKLYTVQKQVWMSSNLYGLDIVKQTLKNDFWNQPYGIKSLRNDFSRFEKPTPCMDFYTFAKLSGVINKCDTYKNRVSNTADVELHPILKSNNSMTAVKRNVQFGFPVAWMRYYTDDMDDFESTASTELLFSDDDDEEMSNDQEVPSNDDILEPPQKRIRLDNKNDTTFFPVFEFPEVLSIPPLTIAAVNALITGNGISNGAFEHNSNGDCTSSENFLVQESSKQMRQAIDDINYAENDHDCPGAVDIHLSDSHLGSSNSQEYTDEIHDLNNPRVAKSSQKQHDELTVHTQKHESSKQDDIQAPSASTSQMTKSCEQSFDDSIVQPCQTPEITGSTSKQQQSSPNSQVQLKCKHKLAQVCESDVQRHCLNDFVPNSSKTVRDYSRKETSHPDDFQLHSDLPNSGTETVCEEGFQTVLDDFSYTSGNTPVENDAVYSHRLCSSVFYVDEGAYLNEISLSPLKMSDDHSKICSAQQVLDDDASFYNDQANTDDTCIPTITSWCKVRKPELPIVIPVEKEQESAQEIFRYDDIDVDSCSSQISLSPEVKLSPATYETTSVKIEEPIENRKIHVPTEEHKQKGDKAQKQFKSVLEESVDDLEGPELLLMVMQLVESALKKSKEATANERKEKTEHVPAIAPKKPSPAFSWKKFTYENQNTLPLPHNDAEPLIEEDPVPQQFNKYTKLYLNNTSTRPIRLGLSRRQRSGPMNHQPYSTSKPKTTQK